MYRDVLFCEWTWRKSFHCILPIVQLIQCLSIAFFNGYCIPMNNQYPAHFVLTAVANYLIMFCCLLNGLQWAFLAREEIRKKSKLIYIIAVTIYIIIPMCFVISKAVLDMFSGFKRWGESIHMVEAIYNSFLNAGVIPTLIISWRILRNQMRELLGADILPRIEKNLTRQMVLYVIFFALHAVFLFIATLLYIILEGEENDSYLVAPGVFFFLHTCAGDCPLALVMLIYFQHRKAVPSSPAGTVPYLVGEYAQVGMDEDTSVSSPPSQSISRTHNFNTYGLNCSSPLHVHANSCSMLINPLERTSQDDGVGCSSHSSNSCTFSAASVNSLCSFQNDKYST